MWCSAPGRTWTTNRSPGIGGVYCRISGRIRKKMWQLWAHAWTLSLGWHRRCPSHPPAPSQASLSHASKGERHAERHEETMSYWGVGQPLVVACRACPEEEPRPPVLRGLYEVERRHQKTTSILSGAKWVSTMNLKCGYWQVALHRNDK
jgi:hypothetical protein